MARYGGRPDELAARAQRFLRGRFHLAGCGVLRHAIRHRARVPLRQIRRGRRHVHVRHHRDPCAARHDAIHLNHLHAALRHFRKDEIAHGAHIGAVDAQRAERARDAGGVVGDAHLPVVVVVAGDVLGGRQHFFDGRVEPAVHAVADQLAADDQHQHGRNERHAQQDRHQLGAESRKRQRFAALDDQLDDVARQDEREAEQNRDVRRPQGVQHELGEEIGGQARGAVRQGDDARQCGEQEQHAGKNEARIVAQRTTRRRSTP